MSYRTDRVEDYIPLDKGEVIREGDVYFCPSDGSTTLVGSYWLITHWKI